MAEKSTLARPYANAVFRLAREQGDLKKWSDMLQLIAAVAEDPAMQALIGNPEFERSRLATLFIDICGDGLDEQGRNLVRVLIENRRLDVAPQIADLYEARRADAEGTADVEVVSAFELDPAMQEQLAAALERRLGRKVNLRVKIDASLIGGVLVRAGDLVIDASITGRLEQLANTLMH